jgi:chromosome segregation ATPase
MATVRGGDQSVEQALARMKKLEGELQRLVVAVDARLSERPAPRRSIAPPKTETSWTELVKGFDLHHVAAIGGLAALLFTAGWAGSSLFYSSRLTHQVENELRPYAAELADTVATIQADLAPRMAAADELKLEIDQARRDLLARDEDLGTTITEAQSQLLSIRDSAIDDIERRLSDQTDDLNVMLETSRQQALDLDQGLKDVARALAVFDRQLPVLTDGFSTVTLGLNQSRQQLDSATEAMANLDGKAPNLLKRLDNHRSAIDNGNKTLNVLQAQLEALKSQTTRSSQQLDKVLNEGRSRIADWEGVDRDIASRKEDIMQSLDHYADSLNARVREFIEALNAEPRLTGG